MHRGWTRQCRIATALVGLCATATAARAETPRPTPESGARHTVTSGPQTDRGDAWRMAWADGDLLAILPGTMENERARYQRGAHDALTGAGVKPAATGRAPSRSAAPPVPARAEAPALAQATAVAVLALSGAVLAWEARRQRPATVDD